MIVNPRQSHQQSQYPFQYTLLDNPDTKASRTQSNSNEYSQGATTNYHIKQITTFLRQLRFAKQTGNIGNYLLRFLDN